MPVVVASVGQLGLQALALEDDACRRLVGGQRDRLV
jgi:hypothetical protein